MSELFNDDPRETPPPQRPAPSRSRALITTAVALVVGFFALTTFASFYTDRLWFRGNDYGHVFSTLFWTRTGLFLVFGALMAVVVGGNMYLAFRLRPFFRPPSPEQTGLDRYRDAVTPIRTWLLVGISLLLGLFAGTSGAGEWRNYLLWRNGVPFGSEDAYFGRDIGFYVFDLPWYHFLVDFTMAVTVVALIAASVVHYLFGGIRLQTPRDRLSGAAQAQLSVLLGVFVLAKAFDYYLDRFDLVNQGGSLITGMTYTDDKAVLPAKNILIGIAVICAVLFFLNVWRRTWMLPSVGLALLVLSAVLLGLIWPGAVQQFQVKPSEADREAPYIAENIDATRLAYDVDDVEVTQFASETSTNLTLAGLTGATSSVPLVDPEQVREAFEQQQQVRAYYSVAPVLDVDRYRIDGVERALVLGVRELDQDGISEGGRNWSNLHTVYTHGNGIIAAYANQRPQDNQTEVESDIQWAEGSGTPTDPQDDLSQLGEGYETRVYYGEQSPNYSVVGKAEAGAGDVELDLGGSVGEDGNELTTYDGDGDVGVGGWFNQLMYGVKYGEPNFLLSERVNANSKLLYNRNPRDRVEKVAPWLTVDADPYPAIVGDRIQWILDGYTTTDRYPSAQRESFRTMTDDSLQINTGLRTLPTDEINYMRNAVKATVDAYDGTVRLYAWDEEDPILRAWRSAFPDTVQPKSDIPPELLDHLRYPEDLFKVQRYQYARYHVTDAGDFYQDNDRWEVPQDPYDPGQLQPPYRLAVDSPGDEGEDDDAFSLTSVFVPFDKDNLASFVSVDADATSPDYGRMRVHELPNERTSGPGQVANEFTSDSDVANVLAQFNRSGAAPVYGNLLTLPVDEGLMYVQPVYATRNLADASFPILRYVLVKYGDEVGVGRTLQESLANMLDVGTTVPIVEEPGEDPGTPPGDGPSTGTLDEQIQQKLADAESAFDRADEAFRTGDTTAWADEMQRGRRLIGEAFALTEERDSGGTASEEPAASEGASG